MDSPVPSSNSVLSAERRLNFRQQVSSIMYVQMGEHNGGVILNISEDGLAVQAAVALIDDSLRPLRFQLTANKWVQTSARIAWLSESKRTAGLQFNDLSDASRAEIRAWLAAEKGNSPSRHREAAEEDLSARDTTPQHVIASTRSCLELESRPKSASPSQSEVPLSNSKSAVSSVSDLFTSGRKVGLADKKLSQSLPPEKLYSRARLPAHAPSTGFVSSKLKRYLVDERHRIRLYSLVSQETENLCAQITETSFPSTAPVTVEEFLTRVHRYEDLTEILLSIIATGCFWGERNLEVIWPKMIERVANVDATSIGKSQWMSLRLYPALLLLYTGGLALISRSNYSALAGLFLRPKLKREEGNYSLIEHLYASAVIEDERFRAALCGATRYKLPPSTYLYAFLRERLREFIPSDQEYNGVFDRFEYLLALVWTDENPRSALIDWVPVGGPLGLFASKAPAHGENSVIEQIDEEVSDQGKNCPLLSAGLFGGSTGRLRSASQRIAARIGLAQNDQVLASRIRGAG
jgi:hypothetical protein